MIARRRPQPTLPPPGAHDPDAGHGRRELAHAELVAGTVAVPADGAWHELEGLDVVVPPSRRAVMLELALPEVTVETGEIEVCISPLQQDIAVARAMLRTTAPLTIPVLARRRLSPADGPRTYVTRCRASGAGATIVLTAEGPGSLWAVEC